MTAGRQSNPKRAKALVVWALVTLGALSARAEVSIGDSLDSVLQEMGKPTSEMKAGSSMVLNYDDLRIRFSDSKVIAIDRLEHYAVSVDKEAQERLIRIQKEEQARRLAAASKKIQVLRNNGARQDIGALVVPGKVTVIDFFADWCVPCRVLGPKLEELTNSKDDVYLRKIDIVDWDSPIVKQLGIRAVPTVVVIGRDGKQVAPGTSSYDQVLALVEKASG